MGCDIHLHTEVKINGKWEHMGAPSVGRNYALFERMAGVRGEIGNAIAPPRGIPDVVSLLTGIDLNRWAHDGHSHSWLTGAELAQLDDWYREEAKKTGGWACLESEIGYLFGSGWNVKEFPDDYPAVIEDVRAVFWFDN